MQSVHPMFDGEGIMPIKERLARSAVAALVLSLVVFNASAAWFGGGGYDGFDRRVGGGVPGCPQVHNDVGASNVLASSAWLTGMLVSDGGAPAQAIVFWAREDGGSSVAAWSAAEGAGSHSFGVVEPFTPLTYQAPVLEASDYYYRYFATNTAGEVGWAARTACFRTPAPPVLTTGDGVGVGVTAAVVNGALTAGLEAQVWLDIAVATFEVEPVVFDTQDLGLRTVAGTVEAPNPFRITLNDLLPATGYAYRLRAQNLFGEDATPWVWFATHPAGFATTPDLGWSSGGGYDGFDMVQEFQIMMPGLGFGTLLLVK